VGHYPKIIKDLRNHGDREAVLRGCSFLILDISDKKDEEFVNLHPFDVLVKASFSRKRKF